MNEIKLNLKVFSITIAMKILSGYVIRFDIFCRFSCGRILMENVNKSVFKCIFVVKIV